MSPILMCICVLLCGCVGVCVLLARTHAQHHTGFQMIAKHCRIFTGGIRSAVSRVSHTASDKTSTMIRTWATSILGAMGQSFEEAQHSLNTHQNDVQRLKRTLPAMVAAGKRRKLLLSPALESLEQEKAQVALEIKQAKALQLTLPGLVAAGNRRRRLLSSPALEALMQEKTQKEVLENTTPPPCLPVAQFATPVRRRPLLPNLQLTGFVPPVPGGNNMRENIDESDSLFEEVYFTCIDNVQEVADAIELGIRVVSV